MGGGLRTRGIESLSGFIANINSSGQLAVDAVVSVGATTVNVSGETVHLAGFETSGTHPLLYVTQSGSNSVSGIPHKLVVTFSGDNVLSRISGESVFTSISGNVIIAQNSGQTMRLISGHNDVTIWAFDPSGQRFNPLWVENSGGHKLQASIDAGAISVQVSGNVLYLTSGQNTVQLTSGFNVVKISGESTVVTSGQVQVMSGRVSVSGSVVVTSVSGNVVVGEISGQLIRIGTSGFSYADTRGFDYDAAVNRAVAVTQSGEVRVAGNLTANTNVSGQIVYAVLHVSGGGLNGLTSLASITTTSGAALLTMQATKAVFKSYLALPVTNDSGGTQLLSGQSTVVSIKNLGITGSFMWVGSSGTNNAPWASGTDQSGLGWMLGPRDSITIPIHNPELLRVCVGPSNRSGQRISYMISADL